MGDTHTLMALAGLPGNNLAIWAHWFPYWEWCSIMILSSAADQGSFFTVGSKWLYHLSLHCLPIRPGKFCAIRDHFLAPYSATRSRNFWSSSSLQAPLTCLREALFGVLQVFFRFLVLFLRDLSDKCSSVSIVISMVVIMKFVEYELIYKLYNACNVEKIENLTWTCFFGFFKVF